MIIAISGKKTSGKDTVGNIIQYLIWKDLLDREEPETSKDIDYKYFTEIASSPDILSGWKIKKFADKLKDIVCLLLDCTREQLEDEKFKEKELGEEWWYYQDAEKKMFPVNETTQVLKAVTDLIKPTPRLLLQLLGTECGRQIIHPNIWVNALMSEYKPITKRGRAIPFGPTTYKIPEVNIYPEKHWGKVIGSREFEWEEYPNWIITDTRFPNELKAVKDREGISIRVNRNLEESKDQHESETALDNAKFDYVIDNSGSIEELIDKVREILIKQKLLK